MNKETIKQLIADAGRRVFFVGQADETRVKKIEQLLGVTLPDSYKWFLLELGHIGIYGVEIYGNGLGELPSCVDSTLSWREWGLPTSLIVVEEAGDWNYCLNTSMLVNGECPVVDWEQNVGIGELYYPTFLDYLEARIREARH